MKRPSSANQTPKKLYVGRTHKNFMIPKYLPNINNYMREDALEEELGLLQISWNELGITPEYRNVFMNILEEASDNERQNIITQEKNNMKKFRDALLNLKKEIENRESNLTQLKKLDLLIGASMNSEKNANSINTKLQNVISLIKNLRINAVNIVKKVIKVNQITAYYSNSGKFNIYKIKPEYSYDPKYLLKMRNDLKFLKDSAMKAFIEMNNTEIDPFLTNCAPAPNKLKGNKRMIPISDDLMKSIIESRYLLLQETVLDNIERENNNNMRSSDFSEMNLLTKNSRHNLLKKLEEEKFKLGLNKIKHFPSNIKIRNNFVYTKGPNIGRYIHDLKRGEQSRYNSLFYKKKASPFTSKKKSGNSNRIVIMHEEIKSLSNEQFMRRLGNIENMDNDNMMKNEMLNETIEKLQNENNKLKNENNELRIKLKDLENKYNTVKDELFLTSQTLEENQKKARNIKIDENKNIYFNFLQNDLIKYCQIRIGKDGDLEQLVEKTDEEILKNNAIPLKKVIKNYDKNDIKVNNDYHLCENLKEEEIVPELYNTNEEDIESSVNILSNSLRNSIDKSLNTSLRKSITQSNADGIYDSININENINGSRIKFSESGSILSKLTQVFGSVMEEDNENENEE